MDFVDRQSTPVYEEKSCEETTVFVNENGSVSKRRRRKSLGRRVSFAEAPPSLHIFPRDDEYETPTRTTNGGGSPHQVGERRSPRLAAKVVDDDKENRVLVFNSASRRRRGASKALSVRGGGSPALKPQNWLDDRNLQSQAGSEEENTGPVDLRHLSFDQKESEVDDENLTLDSTTFALKFSVLRDRNDDPVLVHLDENSSVLSTVDAFRNEDVLEKDMSFTIIRPFSGRKSVTDSHAGSRDMNSDTSDMITVHSQPRQRMPHILSGDNNTDDEDSMILSNLSVHGTRKSSLPCSKSDNSPSVFYSHNVQNSPLPVPLFVDGRAQVEERWGKDIGDDEINITTGSEENVNAVGSVGTSVTPPFVRSTAGHEDHREKEDEEMIHDDRRLSFTDWQRIKETQSPSLDIKMGISVGGVTPVTHNPEVELDFTDMQREEEKCSPSETADMSLTEDSTKKGMEMISLHIYADGGKDVGMRGTQEEQDTNKSPELANTRATDVVSARIPGGEELDSSLDNADDVGVRTTDKICAGVQKAKKFTGPLDDAHLGAAAMDSTALQEAQESESPAQVASSRVAAAAFEGLQNPEEWLYSATTNSEESLGLQHFENRATKRTKHVRDVSTVDGKDSGDVNSSQKSGYVAVDKWWTAQDTYSSPVPVDVTQDDDSSPVLEGVTAQVPRFSDLLAVDLNSVNSTPIRPVSRSMWMTPPSSMVAARAYVNPERETGDSDCLTSPTDISMEIVEPTVHSLSASPIGAAEESPKISDGEVPDIFASKKRVDNTTTGKEKSADPKSLTRTNLDPNKFSLTFQEKENVDVLSGPKQRVRSQFLEIRENCLEQDRPGSREKTYPSQILSSARGDSYEQDTLNSRQTIDPPHILGTSQSHEEENRQSTLRSPTQRVTRQEIRTVEDQSAQEIISTGESTDPTDILSIAHKNEVAPNFLLCPRKSWEILDQQDSLATKAGVDPTQILSNDQPTENGKDIQRLLSQYLESQEKGRHDNTVFTTGAVDCTQTVSSSLDQEQSRNPSSPRSTGSQQIFKATDLENDFHKHEVNDFHEPEVNDFHEPEFGSKLSDDKPARVQGTIGEDGGQSINVTKMSVEEFFQHMEVRFSPGLQSPGVLLRDPSLAATHHVRTLSECFNFLCLTQPKLVVMRNSCGDLEDEIDIKATAVAELENRLSSSNPAIFSYFQNAPESNKQRIKKQLERNQNKYRLLAEMNRLHFQQTVETAYRSRFLEMKDTIKHYIQYVREQRDIFYENCCQPLACLQAKISRDANLECTSLFQPKLSKVEVDLRNKADLERIEYLKERLKDAESSEDLKLAKLRPRKQAAEDTLRGLKQSLERTKHRLSDLRSQAAHRVCSGKNYPQRGEVARNPHLYVRIMRDEVYLLDVLQDGFQVKTFQENQDLVVELGYRSIVKRRYVVRKVGTAVEVLACSWALDTAKIEEMFPGVNALVILSLALTTSKHCSISATTAFGPLSALESVRFTLPSLKTVGMPEPSNLRASMQYTRILVGNLMEFIKEVGKCQLVVNASSDGGVLGETRFRNAPDDGQLQLELTFIDCILSIKFFVIMDMSCLPLNGYPLGDLRATVKVDYCAPPSRDRFKAETLEHALSLVKPGYQRLVRTYAAVGTFLASLRRECNPGADIQYSRLISQLWRQPTLYFTAEEGGQSLSDGGSPFLHKPSSQNSFPNHCPVSVAPVGAHVNFFHISTASFDL